MSILLSPDDASLVATLREQLVDMIERIDAVVRRSTSPSNVIYNSESLFVNFRTSEVQHDGRGVELSALELKLLRYFIAHRGEVLTRDELLDHVWGVDSSPITRTVDVRIASLRRKLDPELFVTVHGLGYRFSG
jgi:two-component system alkaline phosphatase synthesis response regulator PhoP